MAKEEQDNSKWEKEWEKKWDKKKWHGHGHGMLGGFYFIVFIGAATYYLHQTVGFWPGVLGILKAAVWPAFLIYKVFALLGM